MFKLLYGLFVVSLVFGCSIYVGPVTPRQFFAVIMGLYCGYYYKALLRYVDKIVIAYFIYLLFEGVSFYNDDLFQDYFRDLISKHFVALVAYGATIILYIKTKSYRFLFVPFVICGLINGIVCILQKIGNSIGITLGILFSDIENESLVTNLTNMANGTGDYLFGLLANPVNNGLFMLTALFALFALLDYNKNAVRKCVVFGFALFFYVVLYLIQQRSCFAIATLLLLYYCKNQLNRNTIIAICLLVLPIVVLCLITVDFSNIFADTRYARSDFKEESRYVLYTTAINYISSHLLTGGLASYLKITGNMPHNVVFNAFIYSGVFGAIAILYVYAKNILYATKYMKLRNYELLAASYALLSICLNGLLHNNSLVTGEVMIWVFWAVIKVQMLNGNRIIKTQYEKSLVRSAAVCFNSSRSSLSLHE